MRRGRSSSGAAVIARRNVRSSRFIGVSRVRIPLFYHTRMDTGWDVVVVGAGAAGLVAAFRAAELGRRVRLLEKNRKPGVKILMSGGTRCNITQATDNRGIVEAYGPPGRFLHSALAALSVEDTIALFEAEG